MITSPAWTSSAGMLSTPAAFPFFNNCTAASTSNGVVILCVCLTTVQYKWISVGLVIVQLRAVFCPSVQYLSFFCEAFSCTVFDSSNFPLFDSGQIFHELVCPLTVVLPQIFFSLTTLFSYPVSIAFFVHILMLLFICLYFSDPSGSNLFFLSSLILSHRSRSSAVIHFFFF